MLEGSVPWWISMIPSTFGTSPTWSSKSIELVGVAASQIPSFPDLKCHSIGAEGYCADCEPDVCRWESAAGPDSTSISSQQSGQPADLWEEVVDEHTFDPEQAARLQPLRLSLRQVPSRPAVRQTRAAGPAHRVLHMLAQRRDGPAEGLPRTGPQRRHNNDHRTTGRHRTLLGPVLVRVTHATGFASGGPGDCWPRHRL